MTAKFESPSKLCPSERLARKRAAARLRQQRCRARKRQALLEERRQQSEKLATRQNVQDPTRQAAPAPVPVPVTSSPFRSPYSLPLNKDAAKVSPSSPPHEIYKCVSFDSQPFEDGTRGQKRSLTVTSPARVPSSPPRKVEVISIPEEKEKDTKDVPEEEAAAIAAMLSLKTSPTSTSKPSMGMERPLQHAPPKFPVYSRSWESHHYDKPRGYGLRPRMPEYYMSHSPPRHAPPHHHYRYYPSFQRYIRYDYE